MTTQAKKIRHTSLNILIRGLPTLFDRWNINFNSRKQLLELSDEQLRDIGIDRVTAMQEGRKSFWQN